MTTLTKRLSRRNFLLAVGAGGAATAAAVVAGKSGTSATPTTPAQDSDKRRGKGYEETAHVRSYYSTTKV
jgi:hypothetical protein